MYKKIIFPLLLVPVLGFAQKPGNTPVPYTLADRDRLNRVEIRLEALEDNMKTFRKEIREDMNVLRAEIRGDMNTLRAEIREDMNTLRTEIRGDMNTLRTEMNTKFTSLLQIFLWGFGLLLASIMGLVGFMVWDRRSFMVKIEKRVTVLEQKKRMQPA